jgi:hypothetical protein
VSLGDPSRRPALLHPHSGSQHLVVIICALFTARDQRNRTPSEGCQQVWNLETGPGRNQYQRDRLLHPARRCASGGLLE